MKGLTRTDKWMLVIIFAIGVMLSIPAIVTLSASAH